MRPDSRAMPRYFEFVIVTSAFVDRRFVSRRVDRFEERCRLRSDSRRIEHDFLTGRDPDIWRGHADQR
jgi:hypothetical protein